VCSVAALGQWRPGSFDITLFQNVSVSNGDDKRVSAGFTHHVVDRIEVCGNLSATLSTLSNERRCIYRQKLHCLVSSKDEWFSTNCTDAWQKLTVTDIEFPYWELAFLCECLWVWGSVCLFVNAIILQPFEISLWIIFMGTRCGQFAE